MDVTFVSLQAREALAYGILSLTGALRRAGHRVDLVSGRDAAAVAAEPAVRRADVLALSATTGLHRIYLKWAKALRRQFPDKAIIMGGPHPTYFPEVIERAPLDGVCLGEGEESLPELLDALAAGFPSGPPDGWWIRRDRGRGPVERGRIRPPPADLDALAPAAYDLFFERDRRWAEAPNKAFLATRGCPYKCTYCFNRTLNDRYRGQARVLRLRDPEAVIEEVRAVDARWGVRLAWFLDANFTVDLKWLEAFSALWRRRCGLPFMCKLRPERASERVVKALVEANCTAVGVGIESGSERLRRGVLGRMSSDTAILEGCRRLKARGVRLLSFSMIGIPGETFDEALRTVALNVACGVDSAAATILQPYPGTVIAQRAVEMGLFDGDWDRLGASYFTESPLRFPSQRARDRITNLQRLFSFAVEFPEVRRHLRWLVDRPPSELFHQMWRLFHTHAMRHTFYEAFTRFRPRDIGTPAHLEAACRQLGIEPTDA